MLQLSHYNSDAHAILFDNVSTIAALNSISHEWFKQRLHVNLHKFQIPLHITHNS